MCLRNFCATVIRYGKISLRQGVNYLGQPVNYLGQPANYLRQSVKYLGHVDLSETTRISADTVEVFPAGTVSASIIVSPERRGGLQYITRIHLGSPRIYLGARIYLGQTGK